MSVEQGPRVSLERVAWRGSAVVLAIEGVRVIATMPTPVTEKKAIEYMALGLAIPIWAFWGEARGFFKEDLNRLNILKSRE